VDLIVAEAIVVELKTVDHLVPVQQPLLTCASVVGSWAFRSTSTSRCCVAEFIGAFSGWKSSKTLAGSLTAEALRRRDDRIRTHCGKLYFPNSVKHPRRPRSKSMM
jgi:hypothetical protein